MQTARYAWYSFLFVVLWEQLSRAANLYFLVISLLQVFTNLSPTNRFSTALPLCGVLLVSIIKEAVEDWARHVAVRAGLGGGGVWRGGRGRGGEGDRL